ncbi:MAG: hypothetical protein E5Y10_25060 [Mesorhizobium sp.]|uniref:hypothetical protein n=1 Tax=Mesorhizobium sp. TaxID=1871066 RepID=UPI0011F8E61A|nr:hypothetical protein [Mesorhizobium sp.]TIN38853.1 MAG: hypothetical protein E5Y13_15480 [Mesorhizobium sp.]TJU85693.1 MAG: hypothetical protein E5Y10_25060 [Mesorhizobium sp.]
MKPITASDDLKTRWLTVALLGISIVASSGASASDKTCARAAKVAEKLMEVRQSGVSLGDAMDALVSSYPASAHEFVRKLVIDAYSFPRFRTPEYRQRAVAEFRDGAHLACLKD